MKLLAHTPLKPLDLSRPHRAGGPTHLSPSDLSGIISHPKRDHADGSAAHPATAASQHDRLVEQTKRWVAQTFFGTLMKQMRESPFKSKLFEGGRGGEAFGQMYDQRLVEHMARASGGKLVNSIVRRIEAKNARAASEAYARQGAAGPAAPTPSSNSGSGQGAGNGAGPDDAGNPYRKVRIHVAPRR